MIKVVICSTVLIVAMSLLTRVLYWIFAQSLIAGFVSCALLVIFCYFKAVAIDRSRTGFR